MEQEIREGFFQSESVCLWYFLHFYVFALAPKQSNHPFLQTASYNKVLSCGGLQATTVILIFTELLVLNVVIPKRAWYSWYLFKVS